MNFLYYSKVPAPRLEITNRFKRGCNRDLQFRLLFGMGADPGWVLFGLQGRFLFLLGRCFKYFDFKTC